MSRKDTLPKLAALLTNRCRATIAMTVIATTEQYSSVVHSRRKALFLEESSVSRQARGPLSRPWETPLSAGSFVVDTLHTMEIGS